MNEHQKLKKQVIKGSFWIFGANIISRGISLVSTLFLARLLTPEDFGVIGYGFLIVGAIGLLREMGFNSALIYQKNNIEKAASTSLIFIFLWSSLLYLIVVALAPVAAVFFREPRLSPLLRVLTFSLVLNSLAGIPMSLLEKDINFKRRVIPEVINLTVYGVVTVIFAFLGFKYWAFVIGVLTADVFQLFAAYLLRPIKIELKIDFKLLRELFVFGKNVMALGMLNFSIRNIDDFFVGRMLGTTPLGIYNFAYRVANIPATNITNVLGKVLYPTFTKIADDTRKLRDAFLKSFEYVTFLTIPVTLYIILIIPDVVNLFFPKWIDAILPIQLIAYFGGIRSIGSGTGSVFLAKGKPDVMVPISLTQLIFLAVFLYPVIHFWGLIGVCVLVNISITISFVWSFIKLKSLIELKLLSIIDIIKRPLLFSLLILLLLFAVDDVLAVEWKYFSVVMKIAGFPLVYFIAALLFTKVPGNIIRDFYNK